MLDDRQSAIERDLQQKIRDLVEGVVGSGGARVAVTAELNRQSQTRTRLEYDPNGQVEVSRRAEEQSRSEPVTSGGVSVSENTPDAEAGADGETPLMANSQSSITERNYREHPGRPPSPSFRPAIWSVWRSRSSSTKSPRSARTEP
jgi:flagellar M-ring protein FliF